MLLKQNIVSYYNSPRAWAINQQEKTRNGNLQYGLRRTRSVRYYYVSEFHRARRKEALRFSEPYCFVLRVEIMNFI